ncbi:MULTISPECIES: MCE family protein [unclassified Pseudonocardia]|uniref:MCE family protein n=1 Tax=unclassified Pseudonocardia TaxID=2619320 RepID=UPI000761F1E8|nr:MULTISPECIES: MCE family protein [unclassified Pseudonocardia]
MAASTRYRAVLLVVVVLVAAGAAAWALLGSGTRTVTAYFDQTVNLYPRDEVRVLGVQVGSVESVEPRPDSVKVVMTYDADVALPADATAAIISPTLVGVRYVQVGPPYDSGPQLADDAEIPRDRTVAPVEFDRIKTEVAGLAEALAPKSAETEGALNRLLDTTSANLQGQGPMIRDTIKKLSDAAATLANGREDLFATVRNLQTFVTALKDADAQVQRFQSQLADVSGILADNRDALANVLESLDRVAPLVQQFVAENRDALTEDLRKADDVVRNVSQNRQALADVLQKAPFLASNFANFIDEKTGAVTANVAVTNLRSPSAFVCDAAAAVAPSGEADPSAAYACRAGLGPLLDLARVDSPPVGVNPLQYGDPSQPALPSLPPLGGN